METPPGPRIVRWRELVCSGDGLASRCPRCTEGLLGMRRSGATAQLLSDDICTLCGLWVRYEDIREVRLRDWAG